jgi:hypothetical protein
MVEEWKEVPTSDKYVPNLAPDQMTFSVTFTQEDFLTWMIEDFETEMGPTGSIPAFAYILARFRTIDLNTGLEVSDYVTIKVASSGESESDRCVAAFAGLTLVDDNMATSFEYNVPLKTADPFVKEIYAPIRVSGLDDPSIISRKCASEVQLTLDY